MRDRDVRIRKWLVIGLAVVEAALIGAVILRVRG